MTLSPHPEFAGTASIVVGGSGAIGREICLALARAGSNVAFSYHRNEAAAAALAREIESLGVAGLGSQLALEDSVAVAAFVADACSRLGVPRSVVYAAGPPIQMKYISEIGPADWSRVFDADVKGCFNFLAACLPRLKQAGSGAIVAVISAAVERVPARDILSASPKAAIEMLVRGIAKEEGRHGIRANCVGPGWVDGGLGRHVIEHELGEEVAQRIRRSIPLRRFGEPREIAQAVMFLLSSQAAFITGQSIAVDGGGQL